MFRAAVLLLFALSSHAQDSLVLHYQGVITIPDSRLEILSKDKVSTGTRFEKALAYYFLGVLSKDRGEYSEAFTNYENAKAFLQEPNMLEDGDMLENYLGCFIFRNQGVLLKQFQQYERANEKYEVALEYSKNISTQEEMNTLYNIALVNKYIDPLKSLHGFKDLLELARSTNDLNYQSRINRQLGIISTKADRFEDAEAFFIDATSDLAKGKYLAQAYHSWASMYFELGQYKKQEELLLKALELKPNRFLSQVDLGECYIKQGEFQAANFILKNAEVDFRNQKANGETISIFKHLMESTDKEKYPMEWGAYAERWAIELNKYRIEQEKIKENEEVKMFSEFLADLERQKEHQEALNQRNTWIIVISIVALIGLTLFFYLRQKRSSEKSEIEQEVKKMRKLQELQKKRMSN